MPLYSATAADIATAAALVESAWGIRPACILACAGGTDAHWQLWHPAYMRPGDMPGYVWTAESGLTMHPDAPAYVRGARRPGRGGLPPIA